jgi:hypothetical protein
MYDGCSRSKKELHVPMSCIVLLLARMYCGTSDHVFTTRVNLRHQIFGSYRKCPDLSACPLQFVNGMLLSPMLKLVDSVSHHA